MIEIEEAVHGDDCHCIGMTSWMTGSGRPDQKLHSDWLALSLPEDIVADPRVHLPIFITTAHFYLDDMTEENGTLYSMPNAQIGLEEDQPGPENGRIAEAVPVYQTTVRLLPDAPQLRIGLAHAQIELNRADQLPDAIDNLRRALGTDRHYVLAWRLSAIAYGRAGKMGLSAWSLAEYNFLIGRRKDARVQAARALHLLKKGSPAWLRADDIARELKGKN